MADVGVETNYISVMASANNGILSADIMGGGVLISFDNGRNAIYSTALLLSVFAQAEQITPDEDDNLPL